MNTNQSINFQTRPDLASHTLLRMLHCLTNYAVKSQETDWKGISEVQHPQSFL